MALKIRLRQQGKRNGHSYRLVVTDTRAPRDGKYRETLGHYSPREETQLVKAERVQYWLSQGAQLTETAEKLVLKVAPDVIRSYKEQLQARRAKRAAKRRKK